MSILPIVNPANNADGIALQPVITALYPFALDEGSVTSTNCFLVKKVSYQGNNSTVPVPVKINLKKIELTTSNPFTGVDYGGDSQAGLKYRSLIELIPSAQLEPHTSYSVILSRDIAKNSVFDIEANSSNVGAKAPLLRGPYTGMSTNSYRIQVVIGGSENTAIYRLIRNSDNQITNNLVAKKRYIELEKGIFVKFDIGTYVANDYWDFIVKPLVKTNEIYSWDFTTGDSNYTVPADQNSGVIVGLPVENNSGSGSSAGSTFKLLSASPAMNTAMHNPSNKVFTFTFNKNINPASVTNDKIKLIAESTVDNFYGTLDYTYTIENNKLIITFQ
jgi:hypothetical protein